MKYHGTNSEGRVLDHDLESAQKEKYHVTESIPSLLGSYGSNSDSGHIWILSHMVRFQVQVQQLLGSV